MIEELIQRIEKLEAQVSLLNGMSSVIDKSGPNHLMQGTTTSPSLGYNSELTGSNFRNVDFNEKLRAAAEAFRDNYRLDCVGSDSGIGKANIETKENK